MRKKKVREVLGFWLLYLEFEWSQELAYKLIMSVGNQGADLSMEPNKHIVCGDCKYMHRENGRCISIENYINQTNN